MRRACEHAGLQWRDAWAGKDRDAEQKTESKRGNGLQHPMGCLDRAGKDEFRLPVGVEHPPIGADASFERLPGLVESLDDRVVDAHGIGTRDEIANDLRLRYRIWHSFVAIEPSARPAKLGDDDTLAGIGLAEPLVDPYRVVHGGGAWDSFPKRADVHCEIIDGRGKLRMFEPDGPHFGGADRRPD